MSRLPRPFGTGGGERRGDADVAALCGLACVAAGAAVAVAARSPLPLVGSLALAPWAARRWRRRCHERAAVARGDAVIAFCAALAGEVRAGRTPEQALSDAGVADLGPAAASLPRVARYGGDVPAVLRRAARQPGAEGLSGVAACWRVAVDGGASLATGLDRVAQALRAERDQAEDLRSHLAGPRATAHVLAALPPAGLLLGSTMGAQPLRVLFGTPTGLACLAAGLALEVVGLVWSSAILRGAARRAER